MRCIAAEFSNQALLSVYGDEDIIMAECFVVYRFLWDPLVNNSIEFNPFLVLEVLFGEKIYPFGSTLFEDVIKIAVTILERFHFTRLSYYPSNVPQF